MHRARRQNGFTLIEIVVVVMIVATISAMSVLAINQAFGRRYASEADNLLIWLQQLAENSSLQGAAYGVVTEPGDVKIQTPTQLRAVIYYRQRWVAVTAPAPFVLSEDASIDWLINSYGEDELLPQQNIANPGSTGGEQEKIDEEEFLLPEVAFLPDGYLEPQGQIQLSFDASDSTFIFRWEDQGSGITMELKRQ
ncbi:MAG: prepilin-type N-terminal cleavage/methylation domain-containing protein [Porticoccaceae bacterium]|nr:prepilin-type N-terminal cleavage/methylation domain-containing protein [Porticoccaceae bacterium]